MKPLVVTVIALTQKLDFETGETKNYLVLRLPSGGSLQASIDDETVKHVALAATQEGPNVYAPPPARPAPIPDLPSDSEPWNPTPKEFGGDYAGGVELPPEPAAPEPPPQPQAAPSNLFRGDNGKLVVPSRTVPKDEAGNPIVRTQNGVDPARFVNPGGDEDGVASV